MKAIDTTLAALRVITSYTDNPTLPLQQAMILLAVVDQGELPMSDLVAFTGVEQSSVSRNVALLGTGLPLEKRQGYGLIEAYEDPMYRRRKLVSLTARGKMLQAELAAIR